MRLDCYPLSTVSVPNRELLDRLDADVALHPITLSARAEAEIQKTRKRRAAFHDYEVVDRNSCRVFCKAPYDQCGAIGSRGRDSRWASANEGRYELTFTFQEQRD